MDVVRESGSMQAKCMKWSSCNHVMKRDVNKGLHSVSALVNLSGMGVHMTLGERIRCAICSDEAVACPCTEYSTEYNSRMHATLYGNPLGALTAGIQAGYLCPQK
jgi:hypothetical protein